jgi:hypothetical protein
LLEGKNVNLRVMEKEDLTLFEEWNNNLDFIGEYTPLGQTSKADLQKRYENLSPDEKWFFIEKKERNQSRFHTTLPYREFSGIRLSPGSK